MEVSHGPLNAHSPGSVCIGIVAGDEILARRVTAVLRCRGFEVVGTGRSADELAAISHTPPAVVVVACGEAHAPESVELARRELDGSLVAAITPSLGSRGLRDLVAAGAHAVVLEPELEQTLCTAVEGALVGQLVLPRAALDLFVPPLLSPREKQIAGLVVLGFTNGEIAEKLHVAETTVKSHLTSIFRKLGVRSRSEASARILDPRDGLGLGILTIVDADPSFDLFGNT